VHEVLQKSHLSNLPYTYHSLRGTFACDPDPAIVFVNILEPNVCELTKSQPSIK